MLSDVLCRGGFAGWFLSALAAVAGLQVGRAAMRGSGRLAAEQTVCVAACAVCLTRCEYADALSEACICWLCSLNALCGV